MLIYTAAGVLRAPSASLLKEATTASGHSLEGSRRSCMVLDGPLVEKLRPRIPGTHPWPAMPVRCSGDELRGGKCLTGRSLLVMGIH